MCSLSVRLKPLITPNQRCIEHWLTSHRHTHTRPGQNDVSLKGLYCKQFDSLDGPLAVSQQFNPTDSFETMQPEAKQQKRNANRTFLYNEWVGWQCWVFFTYFLFFFLFSFVYFSRIYPILLLEWDSSTALCRLLTFGLGQFRAHCSSSPTFPDSPNGEWPSGFVLVEFYFQTAKESFAKCTPSSFPGMWMCLVCPISWTLNNGHFWTFFAILCVSEYFLAPCCLTKGEKKECMEETLKGRVCMENGVI